MAYVKLGLTELVSAIQEKVFEKTKIKCLDAVKKDEKSPFYFVEVIRVHPENTKTMLKDKFSVWIHAIAEPGESSVMIYDMIQKLQEAMTEDIVLPEGFELILQMDGGVQTIKKDETKEKHAVLLYEFTVCYGFKCKF